MSWMTWRVRPENSRPSSPLTTDLSTSGRVGAAASTLPASTAHPARVRVGGNLGAVNGFGAVAAVQPGHAAAVRPAA